MSRNTEGGNGFASTDLAASWTNVPAGPWPSPSGHSLLTQLGTPCPPLTAPKRSPG